MKRHVSILVGVVALIVIVTLIISNPSKIRFDPETNQTCEIRGKYCYYNDIPSGMLYTDSDVMLLIGPDAETPKRPSSEDMEIFERIGPETKDIHEAFGLDPSKYRCRNTGENPVIIKYFYDTCEWAQGMYGCGYSRKAIVCVDVYFVEQYHDISGPLIFGSFNLSLPT